MLNDITDTVTRIVEQLGYVGVALLVAIENVFPPIPSEVILPLAGFVAGRGDASYPGMVAAATVGSVLGAWILYGIAAAVGRDRLHAFVARHGKWFRLGTDDLERAENWFDRRSGSAVLVGRCIPLIRSLVSIPAGFRRMPPVRFTVYTTIGSLIWNTALITAGVILGDRWEEVGDVVGLFQTVVIIGIVALVAVFVWKRFLRDRLRRSGDLPEPERDE